MGNLDNPPDDLTNILKRTGLKHFGNFILRGEELGRCTLCHDQTQEAFVEKIYEKIERELAEKLDEEEAEEIIDIINECASACCTVGFYTGLKAGARLILNLTDETDIIF